MDDPVVSVLMSVRNGEAYLKEAVDSVLSQDFGDFEFLITDDASTDATPDLLAAYARRDRRVSVVRERENIGLTVALERMMPRVRGRFIARMDADDVCLPSRFRAQVDRFARDPETGVLSSWFRLILPDGTAFEERCFPDDHAWIRRQLDRGTNVLSHGTLMFRKEVLDRMTRPVWRFRFGQELDLLLRLLDFTRFGLVPQVLYLWRWHTGSMSVAAMQHIRERTDRIICELHELRSRGLPEYDWRAREQEILAAAPTGLGLASAWDDYRQGRIALFAGKMRAARRSLRAAMVNPKARGKALVLFCLACLPAGCGRMAGALIGRLQWLWNPWAKYIRKLDPAAGTDHLRRGDA